MKLRNLLALSLALAPIPALAAGLTPVKPLAGYTCMMLNETAAQSMDFQHPVSFKLNPSDNEPDVAPVGNQVAVKTGSRIVNGYVETVDFAFRPRWVAQKYLVPYHAKADPSATCAPAIMSNGHLGFKYAH
ncbi:MULTISPECIES: hypothetical protein [Acetobacter]|uniref:Uncharacterized protein n=1 Tax=Acetobacter oryzoeni TaxID=2500548 RepID=A0A5B9GK59_9PROT|nr:hypothetical protein [Acetobacter oryzoeni]MCP1203313.1 hypothetical protein [Acetobacter oryzoeni]QEE86681.1 hypothetical protein EOV40_013105 [Acetobacter oryzoeni]